MQESALTDLRLAIDRLLPTGVFASAGAIAGDTPPLLGAELPATARMSPRRLEEFAAGRAHARTALERLGLGTLALPVGPDRAPVWPAGIVGSISHGGQLVIAVAAAATTVRGIGIDLELATPLDKDLVARVCRPEEVRRLESARPLPGGGESRRAKLVFSAKESAYKCLAPLTGVFLEFEDLEIRFIANTIRFTVHGHGRAERLFAPGSISGAFVESAGYWITAAWMWPRAGSGEA